MNCARRSKKPDISLAGYTAATAPREHLRHHIPGALRVVLAILDSWELTKRQQQHVLGISERTFTRWKENPESARPSVDQIERLSYILGIRKNLEFLDSAEDVKVVRDGWLHRPNSEPLFGHEPPLKRLVSGRQADLYVIRRYLDAQAR